MCIVMLNNEHYIILGGGPLQVPAGIHGRVQACVRAGLQCDAVTCAMLRKCNTQLDIELLRHVAIQLSLKSAHLLLFCLSLWLSLVLKK